MRLSAIRRLLDEAAEEFGDDADPIVKLGTQETHPLAYTVYGVYVEHKDEQLDLDDSNPDLDVDDLPDGSGEPVVWIVEGSQDRDDPYGVPRDAWDGALR